MTDTSDAAGAGPTAMPVLQTARLTIRPLAPDDLDDCVALYAEIGWDDPAHLAAEACQARADWLDWTCRSYDAYEALRQPPYGERAATGKGGEFLGLVGVVPSLAPFDQLPMFGGREDARMRPEVGLFWAFRPAFQGQGFATEAARALVDRLFASLNLARIVATTERENLASQAVMRRLGMRVEEAPFADPPWFQVVGVLEAQAWGEAGRVSSSTASTSSPIPAPPGGSSRRGSGGRRRGLAGSGGPG